MELHFRATPNVLVLLIAVAITDFWTLRQGISLMRDLIDYEDRVAKTVLSRAGSVVPAVKPELKHL